MAKKPSPRPVSGAPLARLLTSSMAALATHESTAVDDMIALHSAGSACRTTVRYIPGAGEEASDSSTSVRIEMKMGSEM